MLLFIVVLSFCAQYFSPECSHTCNAVAGIYNGYDCLYKQALFTQAGTVYSALQRSFDAPTGGFVVGSTSTIIFVWNTNPPKETRILGTDIVFINSWLTHNLISVSSITFIEQVLSIRGYLTMLCSTKTLLIVVFAPISCVGESFGIYRLEPAWTRFLFGALWFPE